MVVSALGLGCFGLSSAYGRADAGESIRTIHRALDLGCNLLDTADEYGAGQNEVLLGHALAGRRHQAFLGTKFGFVWDCNGKATGLNGNPGYVRRACEASLHRLRTDVIDLYYLHRVDPQVPIEDTVGAMADLVEEGKVRYLGLSEATPDLIAVPPRSIPSLRFSLNSPSGHGTLRKRYFRFAGNSGLPSSRLARWAASSSRRSFRQRLLRQKISAANYRASNLGTSTCTRGYCPACEISVKRSNALRRS